MGNSKFKVHFIGIGGIGTSALARWFLSQKYRVSGSDLTASPLTQKLKNEGIKIFTGHRPSNLANDVKLVIHTTAVQKDNPEFKKAQKLGIETKTYAQAIGDLTHKYETIAMAGAHGKSTSTALISLALVKAGFDPTVIIGTKLKEFGVKNFRKGASPYLILEADEYHKSFLNYLPVAAMITNIDREHLDFYKNLNEIKNVFLKFISNIKLGGILVVNKDNKNLYGLKSKIDKIAKKNRVKVFWYGLNIPSLKSAQNKIRKILKITGEHNVSNALGVYLLSKKLGAKDKNIFRALGSYRGAWRRMEFRGELRIKNKEYRNKKTKKSLSILNPKSSILVYDDYAHHPTEIKATLSGLAKAYPKKQIICVFQPHQAKRLEALFKEFTTAFNDADNLILLDIFKVHGRDKVSQNIGYCNGKLVVRRKTSQRFCNNKGIVAKSLSGLLAKVIQKRALKLKPKTYNLKTIVYLPHSQNIAKELKLSLENQLLNQRKSAINPRESAIIVMMGAGDIVKYTDLLLSSDNKRKS